MDKNMENDMETGGISWFKELNFSYLYSMIPLLNVISQHHQCSVSA